VRRNREVSGLLFLAAAMVARGQSVSFSDQVYPVLERAGCRNCHNAEGVASPTRLRFPDPDVSRVRVEAFGKSLVELVDRRNPAKSLLFLKPTNRIQHTGGERIVKGSGEEKLLQTWVERLAGMSGAELDAALRYKSEEAAGRGSIQHAVLRRLTHDQYNRTVRDLLKDTTNPANGFPPEDYVNGFKNQYQALSVSPLLAEAYSLAAEKLAANAFRRGDSRGLIPCKPRSEDDAACRTQFVGSFGRRAFRRPLEAEESARYQEIFRRGKSFLGGAQMVIEAMLQSPAFLFWMDETPNPKWKSYAAASRLAYFIWDSMPDDALLDGAAQGELDTPAGIERAARRMLGSPKAHEGLDEFASQWLRFDRALTASRERRYYPLFSRDLTLSMTEEARRFLGDLVWNNRNFLEAFTANYSFINSDLAAIYKVSPPARDWDRVEFPPESERGGLLGQALFLTLTSKPDDTAPTGRGLFVREQFLCQHVPPPPPGVDTNLPPVGEDKPVTNRGRLAAHTTNPSCAGCHKLIDPIGFGLEKFDAIGARREQHKLLFYPQVGGQAARRSKPKEVLLDIDTSAFVAGIPDSNFGNPRQLGAILARTPECAECVVKQLFRYMAGRQDTPADRPLLNAALDDFRKSQFRFQELMVSLLVRRDALIPRRDADAARNHPTP
jgi:hypothetical protein